MTVSVTVHLTPLAHAGGAGGGGGGVCFECIITNLARRFLSQETAHPDVLRVPKSASLTSCLAYFSYPSRPSSNANDSLQFSRSLRTSYPPTAPTFSRVQHCFLALTPCGMLVTSSRTACHLEGTALSGGHASNR